MLPKVGLIRREGFRPEQPGDTLPGRMTGAGLLTLTVLVLMVSGLTSEPASPGGTMVWSDRVEHVETREGFAAGRFDGTRLTETGEVTLLPAERGYPLEGTWVGPVVETAHPFTELMASFNLGVRPSSGGILEVRVRLPAAPGAASTKASGDRGGEDDDGWSPWMYFQSWGQTLSLVGRVNRFADGQVAVDILELSRPAVAYQVRVRLQSFDYDPSAYPTLRRVSVCYSGKVDVVDVPTGPLPRELWARDLRVPFRPQGDPAIPRPLWSQICSPTCVAMVLAHFGVDRPTLHAAKSIFDPHYDLFGNWGRAVSYAAEHGLDAYLTRMRSLEGAKRYIAEGVPLILSVRFRKGEVEGFLYEQTAGHLIVLRGFTPEGDAIVNDPASREKGDGVVYKAVELEKAWLGTGSGTTGSGGVAYVIRPRRP